jgi:NDP-sugar pyrophosphorylase family protein
MKALVLSAGLGTRLRPITDIIPKPLVPINGKPLLAYHLDALLKYGVSDVLINTHHLSEKVKFFIDGYLKSHAGINIVSTFEKKLLGSAGTLKANADFFQGESNFLVVYGDNLTNINYQNLLNFHSKVGGICSIACYLETHPETKGVVEFDERGRILRFVEKANQYRGVKCYANGGIYVCDTKVFDYLDELEESLLDFGSHLFPYLIQQAKPMYAYKMTELLLDIGTLETYQLAQKVVKDTKF